ncbi:MAG: sensor histidine kinase [Dactylosporangium sp.]|nr:sensor histidine kinase [Dactylosporangium sp.]
MLDHPSIHRWLALARRLRAADHVRPWLLDSCIAGFVALLGVHSVFRPGVPGDAFGVSAGTPGAFLLGTVAVQALPLVLRRRAPLTVFAIVAIACVVQLTELVTPRSDFGLLIALYGVARYRSPRQLAATVAGTLGILVLAMVRIPSFNQDRPAGMGVFFLCCAVSSAIAIGVAARLRQAQLVSLAERAARLEVEREQRARLATIAERARVSREMHDIIGHNLAVVIGLADGAAAAAAADPQRAIETLHLISATSRQALGELRRTLGALRERPVGDADRVLLRPQPGTADLDALLDRIRVAGTPVTYTTAGDTSALAPGMRLAIYRIVQEALTNTLKYAASGTEVTVALDVDDTRAQLTVEDTGPEAGHRPIVQDTYAGQGLISIRERAILAGGTAQAGPRPGGGWRVHAVLPLASGRERR